MWDLAVALVPELVGLAVTPAAVIACLLLLGSTHPFRNVGALAGVFLLVYLALSVGVLAMGRAAEVSDADPDSTRGWVGLAVGVLFLAGGAVSWWRQRQRRRGSDSGEATEPPGWVVRLQDPSIRLVLAAGLVLAVLNPNVAILLSGLGIVLTSDVDDPAQVGGTALLLAASMIDFAVPTVAFLVAGERGRARLREATRWLIAHNHVIGVGVLLAFGLLFAGRGLAQLLA